MGISSIGLEPAGIAELVAAEVEEACGIGIAAVAIDEVRVECEKLCQPRNGNLKEYAADDCLAWRLLAGSECGELVLAERIARRRVPILRTGIGARLSRFLIADKDGKRPRFSNLIHL